MGLIVVAETETGIEILLEDGFFASLETLEEGLINALLSSLSLCRYNFLLLTHNIITICNNDGI